MGFTVFRRAAVAALMSGVLGGVLLTVVQQVQIVPLIEQAERHEQAAALQPGATSAGPSSDAHDHSLGNEHASTLQTPMQRLAGTAAGNISLAIGFALVLAAGMILRGTSAGWRVGALWGAAGFAVFFAAPSLGLPPELPGVEAAPVQLRQFWWIATAGATAAGLALMIFTNGWLARLVAGVLLIAPHAVGAPPPPEAHGTIPAALASSFVRWTVLTNAGLWLALGLVTSRLLRRAPPLP